VIASLFLKEIIMSCYETYVETILCKHVFVKIQVIDITEISVKFSTIVQSKRNQNHINVFEEKISFIIPNICYVRI